MNKIGIDSIKKVTSLRAPERRSNLFLRLLRRKEAVQHSSRNDDWKAILLALIVLLSFSGTSYARTTVESLPEVEKMFMQGKYDRVISESGKLIDAGAHGREELFYLKGLSQIQLARFKEARRTFEYMIERYPKGKRAFDGYISMGDAYLLERKPSEAVSSYNDALTYFPDHKNKSVVYYKLGSAYQKLGSEDKAREYFNKVKSASPLSFESRMIPEDLPQPGTCDTVSASLQSNFAAEPDAGGYFYVQAGYFKSRNNAEALTEKLKRKGYDSYLATQIKAGTAFYRVKVGRFKTKPEAEIMSGKLKADGYKTKVCR